MRLIDGDGLTGRIKETICKPCIEKERDYNGVRCRACRYGDEIRDIEDAPEVEAVQVIHGHWIKREGFITEYECSVCQHSDSKLTAIRGHYCWYCGAKMDEDAGE